MLECAGGEGNIKPRNDYNVAWSSDVHIPATTASYVVRRAERILLSQRTNTTSSRLDLDVATQCDRVACLSVPYCQMLRFAAQ